MRNKVLIASRVNDEAAARMRALLRTAGLDVEALDVEDVRGPDAYAGPVLGSAIDLGTHSRAAARASAKAA